MAQAAGGYFQANVAGAGTTTTALGCGSRVDAVGSGIITEAIVYRSYIGNIGPSTGGKGSQFYGDWQNTTLMNETYGLWLGSAVGKATYPYAIWYDSPGVWRLNGDGIVAYYNPTFTKYTPGSSNYERIVTQWASDVLQFKIEASGTGTLRNLEISAAGLLLTATTGKVTINDNGLALGKTNTADGTTGAQTINKSAGTVNFAASATSLVVTNSLVTSSSLVVCTVQTNDTTLKSVVAVPTTGSFTLHANAAATAETKVAFLVIN
jgi:hypothetical protein